MSQPKQSKIRNRQRQLFEDPLASPVVKFPPEIQEQLCQALSVWMQSRTRTINQEADDEQDYF